MDLFDAEDYIDISTEKFDALVTGELTHLALYFEDDLVGVITDHFANSGTATDFRRLLLYRDGLNFQDKIEIVRAMMPLFPNQEALSELRNLLRRIEDFKALRNAFAHGLDCSNNSEGLEITVEIVTRSGVEKQIVVTPTTHASTLNEGHELRSQLADLRKRLREISSTKSPQSVINL